MHCQSSIKILSWACLKEKFRPSTAKFETVIENLNGLGFQDASYLEDKLNLIETIMPAQNRYRFTIDPIAEYMAAVPLVDQLKDNANEWNTFLSEARSKEGSPVAIRGFMLAVRDCCLVFCNEIGIPSFVFQELVEFTGLKPERNWDLRFHE